MCFPVFPLSQMAYTNSSHVCSGRVCPDGACCHQHCLEAWSHSSSGSSNSWFTTCGRWCCAGACREVTLSYQSPKIRRGWRPTWLWKVSASERKTWLQWTPWRKGSGSTTPATSVLSPFLPSARYGTEPVGTTQNDMFSNYVKQGNFVPKHSWCESKSSLAIQVTETS